MCSPNRAAVLRLFLFRPRSETAILRDPPDHLKAYRQE